jgi:hypothetical protein
MKLDFYDENELEQKYVFIIKYPQNQKMKISKLFILFILVNTSLNTFSQVKYIAYDGFDYAINSPLQAKSGGTGWARPWEVLADYTGGYFLSSTVGSLTYLVWCGSQIEHQ